MLKSRLNIPNNDIVFVDEYDGDILYNPIHFRVNLNLVHDKKNRITKFSILSKSNDTNKITDFGFML